ncbi:hypothetical protein [Streptomyces profundus]|uniref:hypothetical protein n=1 Tax=Streptomyces profundus TaxID=2867410 RepID=UPI001D16A6C0|nr:hypothetical protein [Streptomyces sp. MA3_2.13]UED86647.1 hypothetical protein K4G22_22645 [Streptomyces sp. MA3_2.13]
MDRPGRRARANAEADHRLHHLAAELPLPAGAFGQTVRVAPGRLGLCLGLPDEPSVDAALRRLGGGDLSVAWRDQRLGAEAHRSDAAAARRGGGRVVLFPGWSDLPPTLTVAELLATTAIERVTALGGTPVDPAARLETRGHLRPTWHDDLLTLQLAPARHGYLPDPQPCCTP